MQVRRAIKRLVLPEHDGLTRLRFREDEWLSVLVPSHERFGLAREMVLQRVYETDGGIDGGLVVDAGANVGFFSLIAARAADHVVAVEPDPINFRVLGLNLEANGIENVTPLNAAVWTQDGEIAFTRPAWEGDLVSSTGGHVVTDGRDAKPVEAVSLETLAERYGDIDLLKMDIEGAEEEVLPHSTALGRVRRLMAELHLERPGDEQPMVDALRAAGFDVRIIPAASLYSPRWVRPVLRHWDRLEGQTILKLGLIAYLLAPVRKPRRAGTDMPLLVATRR